MEPGSRHLLFGSLIQAVGPVADAAVLANSKRVFFTKAQDDDTLLLCFGDRRCTVKLPATDSEPQLFYNAK